ncbi:MAG: CHASE3 domain-containing protein [Acidobacteriia bacterium]|nr:CHASE3 domain-containing protein [Terriglobia bacterium]
MTCLALVWYSNIRASVENSRWVGQTDDVLLEISGTLPAIADAERTSHGYIITGEDSRLESFQSALSHVTEHLDNLKRLISDNPRQQERVTAIQPRIVGRLKLLQEASILKLSDGMPALTWPRWLRESEASAIRGVLLPIEIAVR